MMDNHHLRSIILKLENRLSDDDRRRLHFFLGNDVPRRIRDDPSLSGTLSLMESLFDQDKINEHDFTFLIHAFDEIQCMDAVKLLKDHMRRMQSTTMHESIQSLTAIMPPIIEQSIEVQEEEDKYPLQCPLITEENTRTNDLNNRNLNQVMECVNNNSPSPNREKQKYLLVFIFLLMLMIGLGILTSVLFIRFNQATKELKIKEKSIIKLQQENQQTRHQLINVQQKQNETIQNLTKQLDELFQQQITTNQKVQRLNRLRLDGNRTIANLTKQLEQSLVKTTTSNLNTVLLMKNLPTAWNPMTTTKSTPKLVVRNDSQKIDLNSKWKENGFPVARNYEDDILESLYPFGFTIDEDRNLVIADYSNHRVVEWKLGAASGQIVAGDKEKGNQNNQLNYPTDVIIDKQTNQLIICDRENRRIVTWPRTNGRSGQIVISNVRCFGLTMDNERNLYVSDLEKHEIKRWKIGDSEGIVVAGGHGRGDHLNQLNSPHHLFIDNNYTLYVSDTSNHRIMKWIKDAKEGIIVAGGYGPGTRLKQLASPEGIYVDNFGSLYIADCSNHRIIRWLKDTTQGDIIVGGNNYGSRLNQLSCPMDLSFDMDGNLYVADYYNKRIQKYDIE